MSSQTKDRFADKQTWRALTQVLKYARELAYLDDCAGTAGADDVFRLMQSATIMLSGLKRSTQEYDELLEILNEEDASLNERTE